MIYTRISISIKSDEFAVQLSRDCRAEIPQLIYQLSIQYFRGQISDPEQLADQIYDLVRSIEYKG